MSEPGNTWQMPLLPSCQHEPALAVRLLSQSNQLQNKQEKVDYIQVDVQSSKHVLFGVQTIVMVPAHHQLHVHHQVLKEKKGKLAT